VPGATQLLLVAADVNDQVGVFVVLAAYSAFVLSGRNLNSEMAYAAQIPQHFHHTATTVSVRVVIYAPPHGAPEAAAARSTEE
jgi:hypothetical protein